MFGSGDVPFRHHAACLVIDVSVVGLTTSSLLVLRELTMYLPHVGSYIAKQKNQTQNSSVFRVSILPKFWRALQPTCVTFKSFKGSHCLLSGESVWLSVETMVWRWESVLGQSERCLLRSTHLLLMRLANAYANQKFFESLIVHKRLKFRSTPTSSLEKTMRYEL